MKNLLISTVTLFLNLALFAQAPAGINYQAIIRDADGNVIANQGKSIKIEILQGSVSGSVVYTEAQSVTTTNYGAVNLQIGIQHASDFSKIDWSNNTYYLRTSVDGTVMGTSQILSVPYALYAQSAGNLEALTNTLLKSGLVAIDYEGNIYSTVKIGSQIWMAENLRATYYSNGIAIPLILDNSAWIALTSGAYSAYNESDSLTNIYGYYYNYYAAIDTNNICPTGWHVPDDTEWDALQTTLGGASLAGGAMKETGTVHWSSPNTGATNTSGFTALPGGYRDFLGAFTEMSNTGRWWSTTEFSSINGQFRYVVKGDAQLRSAHYEKYHGFNIRCIKD